MQPARKLRAGRASGLLFALPVLAALFFPAAASAQYNYGDALLKAVQWFDANKCGTAVATNNVFSWRGACHTSDGSAAGIDLSGGYHDAGDHVKFGLPQGFSAAMLGWALYEYRADFDKAGATTKTLQQLKYFTDYFLKSHPNATTFYYQVGDGNQDHGYWGSPENQTGSRPVLVANSGSPASDILGETAAALALMSINYKSTDSAYASRCLTAAKELFTMATTNLGRGSDGSGGSFYRSTSHYDDLSWAAIWLSIATGDKTYLNNVDAWINQPNDGNDNPYQKKWAMAWDDQTLGVLLKMYELTGQSKYFKGLDWNLNWYANTLTKTPYGLPWLDSWGVLRYASSEAGLGYLAYKKWGTTTFYSTANFIVDYTLGTNPRRASYVSNYLGGPQHPHHRANEPQQGGPTHGMVGALVGGPGSGDDYSDSVGDYTRNEVALDYNASYVFALAGKNYFANGGKPGTPPPPPMSDPGTGTGLTGSYFSGTGLSGTPLLVRTDPTVNFNWAGGAPGTGLPQDSFSVRWEGQVEARSDETYTFCVTSDDGERLTVNGVQITNDWVDHAAAEKCGSIDLKLGQRYPIKLEFYENGGDASVTLSWSTPLGIPDKVIIPTTQLYPSGAVPTPDFALSAAPATLTVMPGSSGTSTVTVRPLNGFTGSVALSATGLPPGVSATFTPTSTTGTSTLTIAAPANAAATTAAVTITGTSGALSHATTLDLTIGTAVQPDFTIALVPPSLSLAQGSSGTVTINISRIQAFAGSVALSASGLPAGVTASFSPTSVTGTSSTLTLTASGSAAVGPASVTVTGTSGTLVHGAALALTVTTTNPGDFAVTASPASVAINRGASGTSTISIARTGGFTGAVALTASGLPAGVTASFSPASVTGTSSTLTLAASSSAATGPATVTVTGTSGSLSHAVPISLTVSSTGNTPCANAVTFSGNTGNFNTVGAVCYRTNATINGWGCYNITGRTVTVNNTTVACGAMPLPAKWSDGYTYFAVSAGTYPCAGLYTW